MKLRGYIQWFAEQMENKLRENDYGGGWKDCDNHYLSERIYIEWLNLGYMGGFSGEFNNDQAVKECVDSANFAMMLADNLMARG